MRPLKFVRALILFAVAASFAPTARANSTPQSANRTKARGLTFEKLTLGLGYTHLQMQRHVQAMFPVSAFWRDDRYAIGGGIAIGAGTRFVASADHLDLGSKHFDHGPAEHFIFQLNFIDLNVYLFQTAFGRMFAFGTGGIQVAPDLVFKGALGIGYSLRVRNFFNVEPFLGYSYSATRDEAAHALLFGFRVLLGRSPGSTSESRDARSSYKEALSHLHDAVLRDFELVDRGVVIAHLDENEETSKTIHVTKGSCYAAIALSNFEPEDGRSIPSRAKLTMLDAEGTLLVEKDKAKATDRKIGDLIDEDEGIGTEDEPLLDDYCAEADGELFIGLRNVARQSTWVGMGIYARPATDDDNDFERYEQAQIDRLRMVHADIAAGTAPTADMTRSRMMPGQWLHDQGDIDAGDCRVFLGAAPPDQDLDAWTFVERSAMRDGYSVSWWELVDCDSASYSYTHTGFCNASSASEKLHWHTIYAAVPDAATGTTGKQGPMVVKTTVAPARPARGAIQSGKPSFAEALVQVTAGTAMRPPVDPKAAGVLASPEERIGWLDLLIETRKKTANEKEEALKSAEEKRKALKSARKANETAITAAEKDVTTARVAANDAKNAVAAAQADREETEKRKKQLVDSRAEVATAREEKKAAEQALKELERGNESKAGQAGKAGTDELIKAKERLIDAEGRLSKANISLEAADPSQKNRRLVWTLSQSARDRDAPMWLPITVTKDTTFEVSARVAGAPIDQTAMKLLKQPPGSAVEPAGTRAVNETSGFALKKDIFYVLKLFTDELARHLEMVLTLPNPEALGEKDECILLPVGDNADASKKCLPSSPSDSKTEAPSTR